MLSVQKKDSIPRLSSSSAATVKGESSMEAAAVVEAAEAASSCVSNSFEFIDGLNLDIARKRIFSSRTTTLLQTVVSGDVISSQISLSDRLTR